MQRVPAFDLRERRFNAPAIAIVAGRQQYGDRPAAS
jgi:hypothetical protein